MYLKGKTIGIVGSIIGVIFSLIYWSTYANAETSGVFDMLQQMGYTGDMLEMMKGVYQFLSVYNLVLLILGIISFVLLLIVKRENVKMYGVIVLITGILHIASFRILAFVLLLISGIQLMGNQQLKMTETAYTNTPLL